MIKSGCQRWVGGVRGRNRQNTEDLQCTGNTQHDTIIMDTWHHAFFSNAQNAQQHKKSEL